jgi:hypothetical protein
MSVIQASDMETSVLLTKESVEELTVWVSTTHPRKRTRPTADLVQTLHALSEFEIVHSQ